MVVTDQYKKNIKKTYMDLWSLIVNLKTHVGCTSIYVFSELFYYFFIVSRCNGKYYNIGKRLCT